MRTVSWKAENVGHLKKRVYSCNLGDRLATKSWVAEEFSGMALGDERLNKRAKVLMERLSAKPTASLPMACRGWGETVAAYRFLGNDEVDWQAILAPHWARTRERMRAHPVVLCLQDTTELDFNGQGIAGLGRLNYEARRGMYLHPTYAVTVEREPLGVLDAWMWAREEVDAPGERTRIKESTRWIEGYERVAELALGMAATRLVYVADREAVHAWAEAAIDGLGFEQHDGHKRLVVGAHYGTFDFIVQRVTAVIMAVYTVVLLLGFLFSGRCPRLVAIFRLCHCGLRLRVGVVGAHPVGRAGEHALLHFARFQVVVVLGRCLFAGIHDSSFLTTYVDCHLCRHLAPPEHP